MPEQEISSRTRHVSIILLLQNSYKYFFSVTVPQPNMSKVYVKVSLPLFTLLFFSVILNLALISLQEERAAISLLYFNYDLLRRILYDQINCK